MTTAHDDFVMGTKDDLQERFVEFVSTPRDADVLHSKFEVPRKAGWDILKAHDALQGARLTSLIEAVRYRPFDDRCILYDDDTVWRTVRRVGQHMINGQNLGLLFARGSGTYVDRAVGVSTTIIDQCAVANKSAGGGISYLSPIYTYDLGSEEQIDAFAPKYRALNLEHKLYADICAAAEIDPANQAGADDDFRSVTGEARPSEIKVFDYVYGVLHSPAYRTNFAEFLKIDFPRIPYPISPQVFAHVSDKGEQLRRLHLMEAPAIGDTPYPYQGEGNDVVASGFPKFEDGKVHINANQYFEGVPTLAWNFHIGGYQPAQKWIKDRRGRTLSWDDIRHYQSIVKICAETDRIMKEINLPLREEHVTE